MQKICTARGQLTKTRVFTVGWQPNQHQTHHMKSRPNRSLCRSCIRKILTQKCFCTKFPFLSTLFQVAGTPFRSYTAYKSMISIWIASGSLRACSPFHKAKICFYFFKKVWIVRYSVSWLEHSFDGEWSGSERVESDALHLANFQLIREHIVHRYTVRIACENHRLINGKN